MSAIVYVTVPAGVFPGDAIRVTLPDGSGRMANAVVPYGMTFGSTFGVEYPVYTKPLPPKPITPSPSTPPAERLLLVRVPAGTPSGAMINIAIPDEPGRMVSARVPPNVTEFQVAYIPTTVPTVNSYTKQQQPSWQTQPPPPPPSNPSYVPQPLPRESQRQCQPLTSYSPTNAAQPGNQPQRPQRQPQYTQNQQQESRAADYMAAGAQFMESFAGAMMKGSGKKGRKSGGQQNDDDDDDDDDNADSSSQSGGNDDEGGDVTVNNITVINDPTEYAVVEEDGASEEEAESEDDEGDDCDEEDDYGDEDDCGDDYGGGYGNDDCDDYGGDGFDFGDDY